MDCSSFSSSSVSVRLRWEEVLARDISATGIDVTQQANGSLLLIYSWMILSAWAWAGFEGKYCVICVQVNYFFR